ncbi:MAG: hypothetical protein P0Y66_22135 [Candidatus Kaistia colombiensis]|nr:MAG: hypothetical protein P0Y66_22135 [Kaistia sp.]
MRTAVISGGIVANVVLAGAGWTPPEGSTAVASETAEIGDLYSGGVFSKPPVPAPTLDEVRAAKLDAIGAQISVRLAAGAPIGGLHIALDDGSRADMTAMGTTAIGAASSAIPWPASYALGWITIENVRIPLPGPADGLGLAATVGDHYAQLRQHGRDLKDLVEAAETIADLDTIDETAGWPDE